MDSQNRAEILKGLAEAVITYNEDMATKLAARALEAGIEANEAILQGLARGMERVGELYGAGEYFVPELLGCADALNAGLQILKPHIKSDTLQTRFKVLIGTVEGDIHDIGKNLVRIMYEGAGWDVYDLGVNVKADRFVEEQRRVRADVVGVSALMTTSMVVIPNIIKALKSLDPAVTVMAGGAPITRETAGKLGADGFAANCGTVVRETLEALQRARSAQSVVR